MPLCHICQTRFYAQTMSEPAEPCDCGQNVSREDMNAMSDEAYAEATRTWNEKEATC